MSFVFFYWIKKLRSYKALSAEEVKKALPKEYVKITSEKNQKKGKRRLWATVSSLTKFSFISQIKLNKVCNDV